MFDRKRMAKEIRDAATEVAYRREQPQHVSNGEEFHYRDCLEDANAKDFPTHIANFTKGLPHDDEGFLLRSRDYMSLVRGIQSGNPADFEKTPLGPEIAGKRFDMEPGILDCTEEGMKKRQGYWKSDIARQAEGGSKRCKGKNDFCQGAAVRAWESAGAGHLYDLEGPDAQSVTMPPAPTLCSDELAAEMAEDYLMALMRDVPFAAFREGAEEIRPLCLDKDLPPAPSAEDALGILNGMTWFQDGCHGLTAHEKGRKRGPLTLQTLFRGQTPGEDVGPYLSQFLLTGNRHLGNACLHTDGHIQYGAIRVDLRVRVAEHCKDYMTNFQQWLDVQNGADLRGIETYRGYCGIPDGFRFITTPRDMATYVHYDALYEAYLNACLFLLAEKYPLDPGIPFQDADVRDKQQGFAHFGGPHILSLVCEVATRALKAVRFQKFNIHRRCRPEAVAGLVHMSQAIAKSDTRLDVIKDHLLPKLGGVGGGLLKMVFMHNEAQNKKYWAKDTPVGGSFLLPMAFPEGSPMHPAYGAGHATVAGACVTVLKAFFDHGAHLRDVYESHDGTCLVAVKEGPRLTVEGELNKLAANIAIGRNWAGVHYYSDYIESMRLGEKIALGILEEQKLTYGENFTMTVPLFDGGTVRI